MTFVSQVFNAHLSRQRNGHSNNPHEPNPHNGCTCHLCTGIPRHRYPYENLPHAIIPLQVVEQNGSRSHNDLSFNLNGQLSPAIQGLFMMTALLSTVLKLSAKKKKAPRKKKPQVDLLEKALANLSQMTVKEQVVGPQNLPSKENVNLLLSLLRALFEILGKLKANQSKASKGDDEDEEPITYTEKHIYRGKKGGKKNRRTPRLGRLPKDPFKKLLANLKLLFKKPEYIHYIIHQHANESKTKTPKKTKTAKKKTIQKRISVNKLIDRLFGGKPPRKYTRITIIIYPPTHTAFFDSILHS